MESEEDNACNEGYTGGYSDQNHLNDNDKLGNGSDDREVELHVPYVLFTKTQERTAKGTSPPTKPIKISSWLRRGTSNIDTKIPKATKLLVTVYTGQVEISTYVKPTLSYQVNINDSIIVKRYDMILVLSNVWV